MLLRKFLKAARNINGKNYIYQILTSANKSVTPDLLLNPWGYKPQPLSPRINSTKYTTNLGAKLLRAKVHLGQDGEEKGGRENYQNSNLGSIT